MRPKLEAASKAIAIKKKPSMHKKPATAIKKRPSAAPPVPGHSETDADATEEDDDATEYMAAKWEGTTVSGNDTWQLRVVPGHNAARCVFLHLSPTDRKQIISVSTAQVKNSSADDGTILTPTSTCIKLKSFLHEFIQANLPDDFNNCFITRLRAEAKAMRTTMLEDIE